MSTLPYLLSCREASACQIYDELLATALGSTARRSSIGSSNAFPKPATSQLPWLYYLPGSPYLTTNEMDLE
jgi:hypothetical protein